MSANMTGPESVWTGRREPRPPRPNDTRTAFEVDSARVIHSPAFRRLQGKTQVLHLGDNDFYRTRLTHSLEVAQIAMSIAVRLEKNENRATPDDLLIPCTSLMQTISHAHDLGHPPFGHGGEIALNYCMREHGGFEGNGQTLRLLARLDEFTQTHGTNLTRRSLLGVLKYPIPYGEACNTKLKPCMNTGLSAISIINREISQPPKCYLDSEKDVVNWILEPFSSVDRQKFCEFSEFSEKVDGHRKSLYKSFDCSIMDIADDIAYGVHDLEDAITLKFISEEKFCDAVRIEDCKDFLADKSIYDKFVGNLFGESSTRKNGIGALVNYFLTKVVIEKNDGFESPLLEYYLALLPNASAFLKILKDLVMQEVINHWRVQHLEFKGQRMVVAVFEALQSEPMKFLLEKDSKKYKESKGSDGDKSRIICDYIAGMTDGHLLNLYDRLFSSRMGSIFDNL